MEFFGLDDIADAVQYLEQQGAHKVMIKVHDRCLILSNNEVTVKIWEQDVQSPAKVVVESLLPRRGL